MIPESLQNKLEQRKNNQELRELKVYDKNKVDFFSNDYLGYATNKNLIENVQGSRNEIQSLGSTGSRLISGNSKEIENVESFLANYYSSESGLLLGSGFVANLALFSCVPQKGDVVLYDELIHASIRESVRLSFAKSYSFKHLDFNDLEKKLQKNSGNVYVVLEGLYSMDGDIPNKEELSYLKEKYSFHLILDEAHSTGILGRNHKGFYENLPSDFCFARIHTFGKAFGYHGAFIACSHLLKQYLINFSKPFIYSTGIPLETALTIQEIHKYHIENGDLHVAKLNEIIAYYKTIFKSNLNSPIQLLYSENLKEIEEKLEKNGFLIKCIYSPTVPKNTERIRLTLHSYNTKEEINHLKRIIKLTELKNKINESLNREV
ncbi:MAG: pyridoxal phosphate-dependent aminotransferase family protein [Flavobacteriales bacterium]|nr:pyridoxal phosphate-dependent aminotransferase family protein [Flavobacteriales bacterium]